MRDEDWLTELTAIERGAPEGGLTDAEIRGGLLLSWEAADLAPARNIDDVEEDDRCR